jgi:hypothetical protein
MADLVGSLEDLAKNLGSKVIEQVKNDFGDAWDDVKGDVKDILSDVAKDAGRLAVKRMQGDDTSEEEKHIHAQLLNLKVAGEIIAARTFWESFDKVMGIIGTSLGTIAGAALKSLLGGVA